MKKFYLTILVTLLSFIAMQAQQCDPCPRMLNIYDIDGCINLDLTTQFSTMGSAYYGNADSNLIIACKISTTSLSINALSYLDAVGGLCTYGTISIDSISTTGGNTLSYINNQLSVQWGSVSSGTIYISFSIQPANANLAPCKNAIILSFQLIDPPIANFTASPQPACFSNPTPITFNASTSTNATSFYWDFGDGFTSTAINPIHNYNAAGTYTVCLYVTNKVHGGTAPADCKGCVDTFCQTITIDPLPPPDITCITTVCSGASKKYCTSAASCSSYNWSVIGGIITSGLGTNCITVNWGFGIPQGTIALNVAGCTTPFCTNSNVITVPIIPNIGVITGNSLVCVNTNENYIMAALPGTNYSWAISGGGNIIGNNVNTNSVNINWNTPGVYNISVVYNNAELGCSGSANYAVTVAANLSIQGPKSVCAASSSSYSSFLDIPFSATNCTWAVSGGASFTGGQSTGMVSISWPTAGTYTITASSLGSPAACATAQYLVTVTPLPIITDIVGPINICANGTNTYYATSTINSGFFSWNATNGIATPFGALQDSVSVTWGPTGPYSLDVTQFLPNGCNSALYTESFTAGTIPALTGSVNVCADDTITYTITNIVSGNFNWYITPSQYGTVYTGQGTNTAQIIWSGNNNPGATNIVTLHYGICNTDIIAINITDPAPVVITAAGSLCNGTGVSLTTGIGSGTFAWSSTNVVAPTQSLTTNSLSNLTTPALYTIDVTNINNTGCNVSGTKNIADIGRPVAQITANNILVYCTSNLPNMALSALTGIGYTYQWFLNNTLVGTSSTLAVNSGAPCNITTAGTYVFYEVTTLNNCTDTSNIIIINVLTCSGSPGSGSTCPGVSITINSVTGCNPFTITSTATGPIGATEIATSQTIKHYIDGAIVAGTVTNPFTTVGYQLVQICKSVLLADNVTVCTGCKDTSVLITVAADFVASENCGVVSFINNSTTYAPTTITGYSWAITDGLGNPIPPIVGSYNNTTIATPILTINQSGTFIITLTVTGSNGCTAMHKDTIITDLPDASFTAGTSCVGTPVNFANVAPTATNYWNFGDATSSYVSPTQHTYATANIFTVLHAVSDAAGCVDTVSNSLTILAAPVCILALGGANPFCSNDSLPLIGCAGYTNYQWYKNGIAITGLVGIQQNFTVTSAGNYHCTGNDANGCNMISDTINATVLQAPSAIITQTNAGCVGNIVSLSVPGCLSCNIVWKRNYITLPSGSNIISGTAGSPALPIGTLTITVMVTDFSTGCISVDTTIITIVPNPTITTNVYGTPSPNYCSNNLYTLEALSNAVSPSWAWIYSGQTISTNDSIQTAADGVYNVQVTDGVTGCTANGFIFINASPDLNLFPIGCDTLCDTSTVLIQAPIPNINNVMIGYTIDWYDNAPPYTTPIYTGLALPNSLLPIGNHQLSVIVTSPNGCVDTSTVYELYIKSCIPAPLQLLPLQLNGSTLQSLAMLQWKTFGIEATNRYEVQISDDGIIFATKYIIAKENMAPNEMVNIVTDELQNNKPRYYRIMQVFTNNANKYSNIIQLQINNANTESMIALPNKTIGATQLLIASLQDITTNIVIANAIGTKVMQQEIKLQAGNNKYNLNIQYLPAGLYYISVATKKGILVAKIIKE
jgi:PKD repeat protein